MKALPHPHKTWPLSGEHRGPQVGHAADLPEMPVLGAGTTPKFLVKS